MNISALVPIGEFHARPGVGAIEATLFFGVHALNPVSLQDEGERRAIKANDVVSIIVSSYHSPSLFVSGAFLYVHETLQPMLAKVINVSFVPTKCIGVWNIDCGKADWWKRYAGGRPRLDHDVLPLLLRDAQPVTGEPPFGEYLRIHCRYFHPSLVDGLRAQTVRLSKMESERSLYISDEILERDGIGMSEGALLVRDDVRAVINRFINWRFFEEWIDVTPRP
jgi:hypothetical protein